jgi:hypothetical protein
MLWESLEFIGVCLEGGFNQIVGLVGDCSIIQINAKAALVSQKGPIEYKIQNSGLITSLLSFI